MPVQERTDADREPQACDAKLFPAERLLFAAIQAWAGARATGERPHGPVAEILAAKASPRAASLFLAWIQAVEASCRRPLRLTCAHCGGMSTDAQRLVVACGLAPAQRPLAEALLDPLVRDPAMVMMLATQLNGALSSAGWRLPARGLEPAAPPAQPGRATLH